MPIVYIHGVANRDPKFWKPVNELLKRYVVEEISPQNPDNVAIIPVYWGDVGAKFAWDGKSRPKTVLAGQGLDSISPLEQVQIQAEHGHELKNLPTRKEVAGRPGGLTSGAASTETTGSSGFRLKDLDKNQLSELLVSIVKNEKNDDDIRKAWAVIAADSVARAAETMTGLAACADLTAEIRLVQKLVDQYYVGIEKERSPLVPQGASWLQSLSDRLSEATSRVGQAPGFALSQVLGEIRPRLNEAVTLFLGDVFAYLHNRKDYDHPGEIPLRLLKGLKEAAAIQKKTPDEPIVVLSHSMGGQIVYDLLTRFLPEMPDYGHIRVDFWCATASQIGLFEEQKLFMISSDQYSLASGNKVPFPDKKFLGNWWNVWDHNDILSFTAKDIFEGVDDESYSSGMSTLGSHSGYLERPSFYRRFAEKLNAARKNNWNRP